jgi:DNA-binding NarL/FixJ family response regulator
VIRIVLADDEPLVRAGVRMLAQAAGDIDVCGEAANGVEAVALVERLRPDVVLLDLRMPRMDGTTATSRILDRWPGARIVMLTTFSSDKEVDAALRAGALGYLMKDDDPERIVQTIRYAAAGEPMLSPAVLRRVVARSLESGPGDVVAVPEVLTARERDVVSLVGTGASNAEIADRLHVGVTTVKSHISAAMEKLGVRNRTQLAVEAYRIGLAQQGPIR